MCGGWVEGGMWPVGRRAEACHWDSDKRQPRFYPLLNHHRKRSVWSAGDARRAPAQPVPEALTHTHTRKHTHANRHTHTRKQLTGCLWLSMPGIGPPAILDTLNRVIENNCHRDVALSNSRVSPCLNLRPFVCLWEIVHLAETAHIVNCHIM